LPLARLRRLRIRGPAPPRRRCGHPRHLLRTNGCGPDQRAGSSGSIWNNRATAPQYPPRNANLDVVEGNLQRILKEIPRGPQPRLKPGFSSGAKHRPQVLGHGRRWRL